MIQALLIEDDEADKAVAGGEGELVAKLQNEIAKLENENKLLNHKVQKLAQLVMKCKEEHSTTTKLQLKPVRLTSMQINIVTIF